MKRAESVSFSGTCIGKLHVRDWGVVFDPIDNRPAFSHLRILTWETVEAAQSEITKTLEEFSSHG
jgi:hypothetical protein